MPPNTLVIRSLADRYRACLADGTFRSALVASVAFTASVIANFYAGLYATLLASNPVTDIILSSVGPFDLGAIFVYGTFALIGFAALVLAWRPERIPLALYSLALFYLVRAVFVSLTHIGSVPIPQTENFGLLVTTFFFGGDRFFSGHTGAPFLMALIFWNDRPLRAIFLAISVFFGAVVLLGHLHYSIDVAAAFFIAYGIFRIVERRFEARQARSDAHRKAPESCRKAYSFVILSIGGRKSLPFKMISPLAFEGRSESNVNATNTSDSLLKDGMS